MMFRFAYPVLLVLLTGVIGYLLFEFLKKGGSKNIIFSFPKF